MPAYYPSMVCNFRLAFDPSLQIRVLPTPFDIEQAVARGDDTSAIRPSLKPLIVSKGRASDSYVLNRVPREARIELPGHRPAGTFSLSMNFREMPIDPRTIFSGAVDIYLGTVRQTDFRDGIRGAQRRDESLRSTLRTTDYFGDRITENRLMTGIIDEWEVVHGADTGDYVRISGRDIRGALIDTPIATSPKEVDQLLDTLDLRQPVDEVVKEILALHEFFGKMQVTTNPAEWPDGTVTVPGNLAFCRHRKGAKGNKAGKASSGSSADRMSFWDLIVKICYLVGAVPHIVGTDLRIRPARSLYTQIRASFDPTVEAPFAGGIARYIDPQTGTLIEPLSIRRMVYGRDIEEIKFTRKFGGRNRPIQVRAIGIDACSTARGRDRMIQAIWPPLNKEQVTKLAAGGQISQKEFVNIPIAGIRDTERLKDIAKAIYEEIGRGEAGGTCVSKNLASFGGDNTDPDLIRLRPGDAIEFVNDVRPLRASAPLVSQLTDSHRVPFEKQVAEVQKRLGDENLARVIVATTRGTLNEVQRFFRTAAVSYGFGEGGLQIDFDFQNYIEKIFDVGGDSSRLPGSVQRKTVPSKAGV